MTGKSVFLGYWFNFVQDSGERGKSRSKRSGPNEERMAIAMGDEEDRSGKAAAGRILHEIKPIASF